MMFDFLTSQEISYFFPYSSFILFLFKEIDYTADLCIREVERLREMSPLWEMIQEGIDLKSIEWSQH